MFYVVKHGEVISTIADICTSNKHAAVNTAEELHNKTGDHYHVIKVETVWTTKTLAEAMEE